MYFSQVRVDPNDPDVVFYAGVKLHRSFDGGKTVTLNVTQTIHDDVHAIWIDPANSQHLIIGNDGGVAVSWDQAQTWNFVHNLPVGLFYHVGVDNATPYNICGGMQDNYVWCGPSAVRGAVGIAGFNWATMQGGDGFVALQDPGDPRVAYSESQDGNMVRIDRVTGETMSIRPLPEAGEPALRWNWDTPLVMSSHDPKVIYAAANKVFRSANRGLNWESSGSDLTANANRDDIVTMGLKGSDIRISKNDGIAAWPTIVSFAESREARHRSLRRHRRRQHSGVARYGTIVDQRHRQHSRPSEGHLGVGDRAVQIRRSDGVRDVRRTSRERLQHVRLRQSRLRADLAVCRREPERPGHQDDDRGHAERRRPVRRCRDRIVRVDRPREELDAHCGQSSDRADRRDCDPSARQRDGSRHAWSRDLDPGSPRADSGVRRRAGGDQRMPRLFTPPPFAMYRRPARDRNYEFWGDQTFYGENPPAAAVISWFNKKPVSEVKLRITSAAGREIREISGAVLANSTKAGIQSACWDLRVQPLPSPPAEGRGRGREGRAGAAGEEPASGGLPESQGTSSAGAGCVAPAAPGGGGFGGGNNTAGPLVIGGLYNVSLIVDGKTVDTKSLRVNDDPDVVLTAAERKRQFDMAMDIHALQPAINDASAAFGSLTRQMNELSTTLRGRTDVPAAVQTSFDAFNKELGGLAPRLTAPQGRGGGGRGGATESLVAKANQAKNALMGGMAVGEQTMRAYTETRAQAPLTITDLNAVIAKGTTLSAALAPFNLTLNVPQPVKVPEVPGSRPR